MRLLAALLLACLPGAALGQIRADGHPPRSAAHSPYYTDWYFDVDGDTQRQVDARNCNNPAAVTINDCTTYVLGTEDGFGWTPNANDCSTQFDCVDPNTAVSTCAYSQYCRGGSWANSGLMVLDDQVAAHLGRQPSFPERPVAVIQVGDEADQHMYDALTDNRNTACTSIETNQTTKIRTRYVAPLLAGGMPTIAVAGNHDCPNDWQTQILPLMTGQPGFVAQATDATNLDTTTIFSVLVQTPVGKVCILASPFVTYSQTAAAAVPLVGCGGTYPTLAVTHYGALNANGLGADFYWGQLGENATTQVVDRTGHPEVWASVWGHTLNCEQILAVQSGVSTNSTKDIVSLKENWQWCAGKGSPGDAALGGNGYKGVSAINGTDGMIGRCKVSPARGTIQCRPYNPVVKKYGIFNYPSQAYGQINGAEVAFDWCTRFGC